VDKKVVKGIGEDTAVVKISKDRFLLLTSDMLIEDVHFKIKEATPFQIGWKALGCSLSDIASMGGNPLYALISLGIPKDISFNFIKDIYSGIEKLANIFKVSIIGGDTNRAEKLIIDIFLLGEAKNKVIYRSGAKVNDIIGVTGKLGNSYKLKKHLKFMPRIKEANFLVNNFRINSMIDISDGLSSDLFHLLQESNKGAIIFAENIPLNKGAKIEQALNEGEDFELLFTLPEKEARIFSKKKSKIGIPVSFIGKVIEDKGRIWLYSKKGKLEEIFPKGYSHF